MTARDLIQAVLMATTDKRIKKYGGDPLDIEVRVKATPIKDDVQVRTHFNKPIIVLFEDEGD